MGGLALVVPTVIAVRLAQLTMRELRTLWRVTYEMKRRMSVARVREDAPVSFCEGGDPERYGDRLRRCLGDGDLLAWLLDGRLFDVYEDDAAAAGTR